MAHDGERHGTSTLFARLDMATGHVIGKSFHRHRHQEFSRSMKKDERITPKGRQEIHIILDKNYAAHKHPDVEWI